MDCIPIDGWDNHDEERQALSERPRDIVETYDWNEEQSQDPQHPRSKI